jgi:lysophospholipase L1-like esterase
LHLPVEQFACSGATITAQTGANNVLHAQYKAAKQFLPHSDVVIYAGANDIGWLQLISGCVSTNCVTDQTRAALAAKLPALRENMITLVLQLRQQNPHRVIVNTYYSLLAPTDTCFAALGVTQDEVGFIAEQEALFNNTISSAAAQAGATAVNVDFSDHSLCSKQPWIQGISDKAPLHPNALGQQQIATQDAAAL